MTKYIRIDVSTKHLDEQVSALGSLVFIGTCERNQDRVELNGLHVFMDGGIKEAMRVYTDIEKYDVMTVTDLTEQEYFLELLKLER